MSVCAFILGHMNNVYRQERESHLYCFIHSTSNRYREHLQNRQVLFGCHLNWLKPIRRAGRLWRGLHLVCCPFYLLLQLPYSPHTQNSIYQLSVNYMELFAAQIKNEEGCHSLLCAHDIGQYGKQAKTYVDRGNWPWRFLTNKYGYD